MSKSWWEHAFPINRKQAWVLRETTWRDLYSDYFWLGKICQIVNKCIHSIHAELGQVFWRYLRTVSRISSWLEWKLYTQTTQASNQAAVTAHTSEMVCLCFVSGFFRVFESNRTLWHTPRGWLAVSTLQKAHVDSMRVAGVMHHLHNHLEIILPQSAGVTPGPHSSTTDMKGNFIDSQDPGPVWVGEAP